MELSRGVPLSPRFPVVQAVVPEKLARMYPRRARDGASEAASTTAWRGRSAVGRARGAAQEISGGEYVGCSRSQVRGTVPRVSRAPLGSRDRGEAARRSSLSIAACSYLLALSHVDLRF